MNNNIVLAYVVNILPRLTLLFVGIVLVYKVYFKIRSKYSATVNCWFCNENTKVPYLEKNAWTCKKCEQYNGFSKDGGYNREIMQQFDCSSTGNLNSSYWKGETAPTNGFCDACNEAQRLKIEKLAQFEPKRESRFDEELKVYKAQLEEQYRLCATCDRHLKSVLRDKKKMVLGSKFIEYIVKGANAIGHPNKNLLRQAQHDLWKRRLSLLITIMTALNLFGLLGSLPELNRMWFINVFGTSVGTQLFIACSHVVALWRVVTMFMASLTQHDVVTRLGLFTRTIFLMLLYSLGLRLPQLVRLNLLSLYMMSAPFCILASTFSYNVLDRFKVTRYTLLLVLWSIYAGGLIESNVLPIQQVLMFLTSAFSCLLTLTNKVQNSPKLYDDTASSFHKIYSDDFSDSDTITSSLLSQELNCSTTSVHSDMGRSFTSTKRSTLKSPLTSSTYSLNHAPRPLQYPYEKTSPLSSSMLSLNLSAQTAREPSLNSSFKSCFGTNNSTRSRFGNSVYGFTPPVRNPFIGPTRHLNGMNTKGHNAKNTNLISNSSFSGTSFSRQPAINGFHQSITTPTPSVRSSFEASSSVLHKVESPSRLLSPSRFTFNTMTTGFANTTSNIFAPYDNLNQYKQNIGEINNTQSSNCLYDRQNGLGGMSTINEDLSRTSSRSSGFESQSGHANNSRENSCCPEINDLCNRTSMLDNSTQFEAIDGAVSALNSTFTVQKPLMSPFIAHTQPLSVNCSTEWQTTNRHSSVPRDSFSLQRFNHGLTSFKRGDLLKKWKEGKAMS